MSSHPYDEAQPSAQYALPYMNTSQQDYQFAQSHVLPVLSSLFEDEDGGGGGYYPESNYNNPEYLTEDAMHDLNHSLNSNAGNPAYPTTQASQSHSNVTPNWDPYPDTEYYQSTNATSTQESCTGNAQPQVHGAALLNHSSASVYSGADDDSDSEEDNNATPDARQRGATARRMCCPFVIKYPHRQPMSAACWTTGFQNVSRLKQHLKRNHEIVIPQQERGTSEEEKFQNVWKMIYPDDTEIPSPFGWNKETLRRQQNLRVVQEHESFIRAQFRQYCPNEDSAFVLERVLESFHQSRGADLFPL